MRAKDGKVTAYKSTQKTGGGHYGNYDRHTGNLYQYVCLIVAAIILKHLLFGRSSLSSFTKWGCGRPIILFPNAENL